MSCDRDRHLSRAQGFDFWGVIHYAARVTGEPLECASRTKVLTAERGLHLADLDANNLRLG
jgi:hypothetical protein